MADNSDLGWRKARRFARARVRETTGAMKPGGYLGFNGSHLSPCGSFWLSRQIDFNFLGFKAAAAARLTIAVAPRRISKGTARAGPVRHERLWAARGPASPALAP